MSSAQNSEHTADVLLPKLWSETRVPVAPGKQAINVLMVTSEWPTSTAFKEGSFIKRQAEFLKRGGITLDVFHFRGAKSPIRYLTAWMKLQAKLRTGNYDLVHAQFGQAGLLAFPRRIPLIVTLRGDDLQGIVGNNGRITAKGRLLMALTRWVASRSEGVIVVSRRMFKYLPSKVRPVVIPSGLDLELFRPLDYRTARIKLGWPADEKVVLFVGNPALYGKNFRLAEEVINILRTEVPVELRVVWDVPHLDVPLLMSGADALLFTSLQEGSPNAVKEALACNLPVVSVPVGDVVERCAGLSNCVVTSGWNAADLARGLKHVWSLPRTDEPRRSVQNLDESVLTAKVVEYYQSILAEGKH